MNDRGYYRGIRLSLTPTDFEDDGSDIEVVGVQCADVVVISDDDDPYYDDRTCKQQSRNESPEEQSQQQEQTEASSTCGATAIKEECPNTGDAKKEEEEMEKEEGLDEGHSSEGNDLSTQSSVTEDTSTCSTPKENQQHSNLPQRKPTTGILSLLRD
ncbi:hypothetical protein TRICI_003474 [Trichomonascus ciferrii]|uniref:Uncharacterized protein n=1 Tax=Trichomonascus ciferrii TaxID=44093 RepID=A0A642V518_9ASCO|nr:hypothetical protein TRICI_003474 [Trichomonascus ciferrii]